MATAAVSFGQSFDDLNMEDFTIDSSSLAESFLEDSLDDDDEMVRVMVQCLEVEPELMNEHSPSSGTSGSSQFSDHQHPELDEWMIDMEMAYSSSCPISHDISGYSAGRFVENMVEFEGLEDYSRLWYEMAMDEDDYDIQLWQ